MSTFRKCSKCDVEKELLHFRKNGKFIRGECKACEFIRNKEYRSKNKEKVKVWKRAFHHKHKEELNLQLREARKNDPNRFKQYSKKSYDKNREQKLEANKLWVKNNKKRVNEIAKKYHEFRKTDPQYKITRNLRGRLYHAIKNGTKKGSAVKLLGCSIPEFKAYIESKFQPGMSWDNWTLKGWHLDHIIPLSKFDLTNLEQLKVSCHYTNLQPLWAEDNLRKSDYGPSPLF